MPAAVRCLFVVLALVPLTPARADDPPPNKDEPKKPEPLDLAALVAEPTSEAAGVVRRFDADRGSLNRTYQLSASPARVNRLRAFYADWLAALKGVDSAKLSETAREELVALRARVESELNDLEARAAADAAALPYTPFAGTVIDLDDARRAGAVVDPMKAAGKLADLPKQVEAGRKAVESAVIDGAIDRRTAARAADVTARLRASLAAWFAFYDGYDPLISWWCGRPFKDADAALAGYGKFLDEVSGWAATGPPAAKVTWPAPAAGADAPNLAGMLARPRSEMLPVLQRYGGGRGRGRGAGPIDRDPARWLDGLKGIPFDTLSTAGQVDYVLLRNSIERQQRRAGLKDEDRPSPPTDDTGITGRPIGRAALVAELHGEMIPYTPEELVARARRELEWCHAELRKAAREMGHGDDWKAAVEAVKNKYVGPGWQPVLVRDLSNEAVVYLQQHKLVTVPPLAIETWRMDMMSAERQQFSPYFTGGEVITVAYPTSGMTHDAKLQSLRSNNPHFSRATVHHELIPGHHLQGFWNAREGTHRGAFNTPVWLEGWAMYWELVLLQKGFARTPEDRVGFLVWRSHRCARVLFSFGYHLGQLTPRQCVDLLVENVGFEPASATAEVRRSFSGGYGPLYQAAYLIGAKQFWALRQELVTTGKMTDRAFHDAILREGAIPVEMVRALLTGQKLTRDHKPEWRFWE